MIGQSNTSRQQGYGNDLAVQSLQAAAAQASLQRNVPRSPLAEAADSLEQRLQHLQATIHRLGERLVPVLLTANPETSKVEGNFISGGAPVVDSVNAASAQITSMQRQLEALIDRLAV